MNYSYNKLRKIVIDRKITKTEMRKMEINISAEKGGK